LKDRLSKQLVHGIKTITPGTLVGNNYEKSSGSKRFNVNKLKWVNVNNNAYVKNEQNYRPKDAQKFGKNVNIEKTLYGYRRNRNSWLPKTILDKAAAIPFVGLKK